MMYFFYVIRNSDRGIRYIGSTADIDKRLADHNAGRSRFTKGSRPWILVYSEKFGTKHEALKRGRYLKSGKGREILDRILGK
jgi:putative endonuclease